MPFFSSFALIGLAELGDKTQLLTMALAAKYRPLKVIGGVFLATALLQLIAVSLGQFASLLLPVSLLKKIAGVVFIMFGLWIVFGKNDDESSFKEGTSPVLTVFTLFFLAEFGDKTQLAGFAFAARYHAFFQVWLGATLGMFTANSLGVLVGGWLGQKLSLKWLKMLGGTMFIIFGIWSLFQELMNSS